jgi:hypothetical protein
MLHFANIGPSPKGEGELFRSIYNIERKEPIL